MVNYGYLGTGIMVILISSIFFFGSFGFVDQNNEFTIGGFGLFVGGIVGYIISIYVIARGLTE